MEKKKTVEKSIPKRIPKNMMIKIIKRGNGDFRTGLHQMDSICNLIERDPALLLQKELEHFGGLVQAFLPENHYEHYIESNLPAMLNKFIKTGKIDHTMLNSRIEKPISEFEEKERDDSDAKKPKTL